MLLPIKIITAYSTVNMRKIKNVVRRRNKGIKFFSFKTSKGNQISML